MKKTLLMALAIGASLISIASAATPPVYEMKSSTAAGSARLGLIKGPLYVRRSTSDLTNEFMVTSTGGVTTSTITGIAKLQFLDGTIQTSAGGSGGGTNINEANYVAVSTNVGQVIQASHTWSGRQLIREIYSPPSMPLNIWQPSGTSKTRLCFGGVVTNSTSSCIGMDFTSTDYGQYWEIANIRAMTIKGNGRTGFMTTTPRAVVEISTDAGLGGPVLVVSTGGASLLEVNGTSVVANVPIYAKFVGDGSALTGISGTGGGDGNLTNGATQPVVIGNWPISATSATFTLTSVSTAIAKNVWISTAIGNALLHVSTSNGYANPLVIVSTGDSKLFEITSASLTVNVPTMTAKVGIFDTLITTGGGAAKWSSPSAGQLNLDPNNTGTPVIQVNGTSVTVTARDFIAWTTDYYPITNIVGVRASTSICTYSTMSYFGRAVWEQAFSTSSQETMYAVDLASGDFNSDLLLMWAIARSTGTDNNPIIFSMSVSSIGATDANFNNLIWTSTYVVVASTPGISTYEHIYSTPTVLTGWKTVAGSGSKRIYIRMVNVAGTSTCQRFFETGLLGWRKRT